MFTIVHNFNFFIILFVFQEYFRETLNRKQKSDLPTPYLQQQWLSLQTGTFLYTSIHIDHIYTIHTTMCTVVFISSRRETAARTTTTTAMTTTRYIL